MRSGGVHIIVLRATRSAGGAPARSAAPRSRVAYFRRLRSSIVLRATRSAGGAPARSAAPRSRVAYFRRLRSSLVRLPDGAAEDLAAIRARQGRGELDAPRHLVVRKPCAGVRDQLLGERVA